MGRKENLPPVEVLPPVEDELVFSRQGPTLTEPDGVDVIGFSLQAWDCRALAAPKNSRLLSFVLIVAYREVDSGKILSVCSLASFHELLSSHSILVICLDPTAGY